MGSHYIIAVVRAGALDAVEASLERIGVPGFTVIRVKGRGEHNLYGRDWLARDWLTDEAKIEIVAEESKVEAIVNAIMDAAHTGDPGDGIVSVLPVEQFFRIRTRSAPPAESGIS